MHLPRVNSIPSGEARCCFEQRNFSIGRSSMVECARARLAVVLLVALILTIAVRADDWPQWRGPNRDGVWGETGILQTFPAGGLKVRWRAPVGWGFSSPGRAVVKGSGQGAFG
jgi:hypothetical protein